MIILARGGSQSVNVKAPVKGSAIYNAGWLIFSTPPRGDDAEQGQDRADYDKRCKDRQAFHEHVCKYRINDRDIWMIEIASRYS
jgi:hypothetical protein